MPHIGFQCNLYYNSASYATPTWVLVDLVTEVNLDLPDTEIEVSTRAGGGMKEYVGGLTDLALNFPIRYEPTDIAYAFLRAAKFARTTVELAVMDGPIATVGSQGIRFAAKLTKFDLPQPLDDVLMSNFSARATPNDDAAPAWFTVPEPE